MPWAQNKKTQPPLNQRSCVLFNLAPAVGLEPQVQPFGSSDTPRTESLHNRSISLQDNQLQDPTKGSAEQIRAFPQHEKDTRTHKKCALCVPFSEGEVPEDLAEVARQWDLLPVALKKGIIAMVSDAVKD